MTTWEDKDGNTYGVERASNGMSVCIRTNAGGNRKGFKPVGACPSMTRCNKDLEDYATKQGWKEIAK